jgi:hypothetical protein
MVHSETSWKSYPKPDTPSIQRINANDEYITPLPQLMSYAELKPDSNFIILGMGDHLELWNADVWEKQELKGLRPHSHK